jgi:hypothetical protein
MARYECATSGFDAMAIVFRFKEIGGDGNNWASLVSSKT